MLALAQDWPAVWRSPPPTNAERQPRLRFLVKPEIIAELKRPPRRRHRRKQTAA